MVKAINHWEFTSVKRRIPNDLLRIREQIKESAWDIRVRFTWLFGNDSWREAATEFLVSVGTTAEEIERLNSLGYPEFEIELLKICIDKEDALMAWLESKVEKAKSETASVPS